MNIDEKTYRDWRRTALRAAQKAGASDAWLDDIADEAVERLLTQDEPPEQPKAWLYKVATNLARERHRKEPAEGWGAVVRTNPDRRAGERHYPDHVQVRARTGDVRRRMQVEEVLKFVNEKEATFLVGQAAGKSLREIAIEFDTTEAVIKTTLARARRKIRERFPTFDDFDL